MQPKLKWIHYKNFRQKYMFYRVKFGNNRRFLRRFFSTVVQLELTVFKSSGVWRFARVEPEHPCRDGLGVLNTAVKAKRAVNAFLYEPWLVHGFTCLEVHPSIHLLLTSVSPQYEVFFLSTVTQEDAAQGRIFFHRFDSNAWYASR